MIKEFVSAWYKNKDRLEEWFAKTNQEDLDYKTILSALIDNVINPGIIGEKWDSDKIHVIDDGEYQGTQLFIVSLDCYQPSPYQYFMTYQYYGSCSGCDLLEGIRQYDPGLPNEEQIKEYMLLALHLLQRCRYLIDEETYYQED